MAGPSRLGISPGRGAMSDWLLTATIYDDSHDNRGQAFTMLWHGQWVPRLLRHDEGSKDGVAISPGLNDGWRGRGHSVQMQCAIIDVETSLKTGEVPPEPQVQAMYMQTLGHAAALWTTHSHTDSDPRYRIVVPFDDLIPLKQ